jgi:hypothetical protein
MAPIDPGERSLGVKPRATGEGGSNPSNGRGYIGGCWNSPLEAGWKGVGRVLEGCWKGVGRPLPSSFLYAGKPVVLRRLRS